MHMLAWLDRVAHDFRFAARSLARGRSFTAIALGSLALGIGGSAAMYSVIYAVILDPFPYQDVDRLVSIGYRGPEQRYSNSYYPVDQFVELSERTTAFEGVTASTISDVTWTGAGEPQRLRGNHCTMNTFAIMGVPPLIGRVTAASDAAPGAEPVTVLGYKFWQRQFGGDPSVLGRKLQLNDKMRTIIGVMPPRFMWRGADVYLPLVFHRGEKPEGVVGVQAMARLKAGVTMAQATVDARSALEDLAREYPSDFPRGFRVSLTTFKETFPSGISDALWVLFGAVGLLLVIACVNVSNLLLSRAAYRRREMAVRASLGASRGRLVAQLLSESLLLGVSGGVLGVLVAAAGLRGIIAMVPPNTIPDEAQITMNGSVLLFSVAVSVAAALLFGTVPALQMSSGNIIDPLKESGRGVSGTRRQRWLRGALVTGEVALSVMLLVGASLMVRTLMSIQGLHLGMAPERVLVLRIPFSHDRYPDAARRVALVEEALRRIDAAPGVDVAGINLGLHPLGAAAPVGRLVRITALRKEPYQLADDGFQIVGVVQDVVNQISDNQTLPEVYIPYSLAGMADELVVRSKTRPEAIEQSVREAFFSVDKTQPLTSVMPLETLLNQFVYARPRFNLFLFAIFAALGLTLALFGVYGVISTAVAQQTREIGIRIALGATFPQVMGMVLRLGMKLLLIGVGAGLVGSLASVRLLSGLVRNVSTMDPYSFAAVTVLLMTVGLFATFFPARRAARVDPVTALRNE